MSNMHGAWTTGNELTYISTIGQHSVHTQSQSRYDLLKNYFYALQRRRKWEEMDRAVVLKHAFDEMMCAREAE